MDRKILVSEAADKSEYSAQRVRELIPEMPDGMAEKISPRLYLLKPDAVRWLKNHKKKVRMGRKRDELKGLQ